MHSVMLPGLAVHAHTTHTQPAHTQSPPLAPTSPHAAWAAATPSFAPRVGGATSVHPHACICPGSLEHTDLGDDVKQALRASARSGLQLIL